MKPKGWAESSKQHPCPICGGVDWCSFTVDGLRAHCRRIEDGALKKMKGGGFLHAVDKTKRPKLAGAKPKPVNYLSIPECKRLLKQTQSALSPARLAAASKALGLSERALKLMGIGYDHGTGCICFPMFDGQQRPIGFRCRSDDGRKFCIPGSQNGLFIPTHYDPQELPANSLPPRAVDDSPMVLVMPEGPTDAAAALDCGFMAIGRPSNAGGAEHLAVLLRACRQHVILFADNDGVKTTPNGVPFKPGIEGALSIAESILPHCATLRIVMPVGEPGVKDLRDWVKLRQWGEVFNEINKRGWLVTPGWLIKQRARLKEWKKSNRRKSAA